MPVLCSSCAKKRAVLKRPKTGHSLCKECFFWAFEEESSHDCFSHRGAFRDDSEPAEVPHHKPDSVPDVSPAAAADGGIAADGGGAAARGAEEAAAPQSPWILSG